MVLTSEEMNQTKCNIDAERMNFMVKNVLSKHMVDSKTYQIPEHTRFLNISDITPSIYILFE